MSAEVKQPVHGMTVAEFLPWAAAALARGEGRYELVDGIPIAMSPERVLHGQTKFAIAIALFAAIRRAKLPCHVQPDGAMVVVDNHKTYGPDALVYCGEALSDDTIITPNPIILVEVISPSTGHIDKGDKLEGYFRIPSVQHYLLVYPDQRMVVHHQRGDGDRMATRVVHDGEILLDPPGLALNAADLFEIPA